MELEMVAKDRSKCNLESLCLVNTSGEAGPLLLSINAMLTESILLVLCPHNKSRLLKIVIPLSLTFPKHMCRTFIISFSDIDDVQTAAPPETLEPCKIYRQPLTLCPFMKARVSLETLRTSPEQMN